MEPEKKKQMGAKGRVMLGDARLETEIKIGCWFGEGFVVRKCRVRWPSERSLRMLQEGLLRTGGQRMKAVYQMGG